MGQLHSVDPTPERGRREEKEGETAASREGREEKEKRELNEEKRGGRGREEGRRNEVDTCMMGAWSSPEAVAI